MGYEDDVISEEAGDESTLTIPSYVIDPVDGTNGLILGNGEWSVSVARLKSWNISSPENEGVIYQPSTDSLFNVNGIRKPLSSKGRLKILVSRSEHEKGYLTRWSTKK